MNPIIAKTDEEIARCYAILSELRPHLQKNSFVSLIRSMEVDSFQLAFIEDNGTVVAAAGFLIRTNIFMGKNLYVDDLVTTGDSRSKGYGKAMIDWLRTIAVAAECTHLHLDSGTQRHRAHRFYLRQGMDIASFHFSEKLDLDESL